MALNDPPFPKKMLITLGIALPIILSLLLLGTVFKVLLLILAASLLAICVHAVAGRIRTWVPMGGTWSKWASVLIVMGLSVGLWFLLAPRVADQMSELNEQLPATYERVKQEFSKSKAGSMLLREMPADPKAFLREHAEVLKSGVGVFSNTLGALGNVFVILLLALFFIISPAPYRTGLVSLVPPKGRPRAREVLKEIHGKLENWLKGKLLSMLLVGVLTGLGLWAMGIPLALTLGVVAGLLCFIPNFGPLISMVPAVLIALLQGPQMALYVVLLYLTIQFVESNFITPYIQRSLVELPLAMIMIAQVVLGMLTGPLGLILATPIMLILMQLVNMLYVQDVLGGPAEAE